MSDLRIRKRARDLGVPFDGNPGPLNSITDVQGVEVGHSTILSGKGRLEVGKGPVRTGVTAILPRGKDNDPVFAGWACLNGNGEMTGTTWVEESGFLQGPIMITNTHSVGIVHDAVVEWINRQRSYQSSNVFSYSWSLPVVAETYDGNLNDINGFHVKKEHVFAALENASSGVEEGNVGGGTGMICHQFKGGIGTSSRHLEGRLGQYTLGVLLQANYGSRDGLTIAGVPVGREIQDLMPIIKHWEHGVGDHEGSIIVVVATDAPLLPHQLKRLARRVPLGISKVGGTGSDTSGDIFIVFSTANPGAANRSVISSLRMLPNDYISELFTATIQATEEAIVNALVAAETMTGINDNTVYALPHDRLAEILRKYNRLK